MITPYVIKEKNMTDILTAVSTAVASVKVATDIAKIIKDSTTSLEKAELNYKIADIIGALSDARVSLADANDSVKESEVEIQRLKELLSFKETLKHHKEAYYQINSKGDPKGRPYCQHCWEARKLPVHLVFENRRIAKCPACKNEYQNFNVEVLDENS
jgi:rubrerythrin